ncbi:MULTISPECIES: hypothetical protein [unclassified Bradyrhizobium]|uniref:hypothetical protein n=1 Tax=unclassified Bradyrhizobium TaxID=2631580 RepID=UPI002916EAA9|nr:MULTISPECIES: hypothetical protein [unclassified Bradyrhizobium]
MSSCEQARPAPLQCRSPHEVLQAVLQLLPRGRAWQSNEGGPLPGLVRAFDPGVFDEPPFQTRQKTPSTLLGFWRAVSSVVAFISQRFCDLRLEFWCATHKETHDLWMAEYGLPDGCDPFPDLCTKVAAMGGATCAYYAAVAARAGWSIACENITNDCGGSAGTFQAGCSWPGGQIGGARLLIIVNLDESPSYTAPIGVLPFAGHLQAGATLACLPDITPLRCILDRIVHAEIEITYQTIGG